jgi:ABC-2 type transport system permease protein
MTTATLSRPGRALERPALALRGAFAGTGMLLRLALRRDRIVLPVQVAVLVLMTWVSLSAVQTEYGTPELREAGRATAASNAAFLALLGPFEHTESVGSTLVWRIGLFMVATLGVLAAMAVVRHTRKEEELGRYELVRAAQVGALAPLTSAVVTATILTVAVAAFMFVLNVSVGSVPGALAFAAQFAGVGLGAIGIGAVAAQVATTSRTANTIGAVAIVAGYALRGVGDVATGLRWLHWLSPVGWAQRIDPYGANDYWPFALCVLLFVVGVGGAVLLTTHRDLGAGLLPQRPGPASSDSLTSAGAIARRINTTQVLSWTYACAVYAFLVGYLVATADDIVNTNPQAAQIVEALGGHGAIGDVFQNMILTWIGFAAAAFGITLMQRLRTEETTGRSEAVLATATSRSTHLASWVAVSVGGVLSILLVSGLLMGIGRVISSDAGWGEALGDTVGTAAVVAPAALVVAGLGVAIYGWAPRLVALGWAIITEVFLVALLGPSLDLPGWVTGISPFEHLPSVPLTPWADVSWWPLVVLTLIAAALYALGFAGYRSRDLQTT